MSTSKSFSNETSERYARALFELANEGKELDKIESDSKEFLDLYYSSPEIKNFVTNKSEITHPSSQKSTACRRRAPARS